MLPGGSAAPGERTDPWTSLISKMGTSMPKIFRNMSTGVPKGSLFFFSLFRFLESIGSSRWQGQKFYRFSDFDGWVGWASDPTSNAGRPISIQHHEQQWCRSFRTFAEFADFAEPCAGDGALIRHLEEFGLRCVFAGDIRNGQDALALDSYGAADAIITNPPWSREVLHGLVTHFQSIAPTWLLLDADWAQTRQAAPFLPHCSDIVAIGRVKWIEGSKHTGKDNAGWYKFDARHKAGPVVSRARSGHRSRFDSNFEAAHLRAMRQGLRAVAAIQFTVLFASM